MPDKSTRPGKPGRKPRSLAERLPEKTDRREPDDCWPFTGFVASNGYGRLGAPGRTSLGAHVAAWEVAHGPVPPGMMVMHLCDARYPAGDITYRRCVNVAHLRLGTQVDNLRWMRDHGRDRFVLNGVRGEHYGKPRSTRPGKYGPEPRPVAERFWEKVDRAGGPDACWCWRGTLTRRTSGRNYGAFSLKSGQNRRAHRVAWELTHGPIPDGLVVCHACDVPLCCNPAHLWLGTQIENVADRDRKGRASQGDDHWLRKNPDRVAACGLGGRPGETNHTAVLKDQDVLAIRRAWQGGETGVSIAKRFSVSVSLVSQIVNGKVWKHLT